MPQTTAPLPAGVPTEQRLPRQSAARAGIQGVLRDGSGRPIVGAAVSLVRGGGNGPANGAPRMASSNANGVFRFTDVAPGLYSLRVRAQGFADFARDSVSAAAGELVTIELGLAPIGGAPSPASRLPRMAELGPVAPVTPPAALPSYHVLRNIPETALVNASPAPALLAPDQDVFLPMPNRWEIAMPQWNRYGRPGEYPYVTKRHRWNPFDRNRIKGDEPLFGQRTFLDITATAETFADGRRVPVTSDVGSARPGSSDFFGKGEQFFVSQEFRFTFDLFHGDTSFRPVDWRIQITPAVDVNYLLARENGIVNINVADGTTRFDYHAGLQEAFAEYKIADLSSNYDFLSARAGIQEFSSDFRGFIFVDEQPGVRLFGNLDSDRWEYNAVYFNMLEKDTNSLLNTFQPRHEQVIIANLYKQDFIRPGYTAEFSVHYNKDDASTHYDTNGFLARPAPIGAVLPHSVHAAYVGWTGNGHFGRINVNHAFYQALGTDSLNPIAGRPVTINAQMAAAEVSLDRDWVRYKVSGFYASGDSNPRGDRATGFDAIDDDPAFAGGIFSFWQHESIRLTGTGVALTSGDSLLPDLRTEKEEGQANFVNPGIFIASAGAELNLTPKLKGLVNVNYLRFEHSAPIELLLFESPIHDSIGADTSLGVQYRPPLSENLVITGGASSLIPAQGFRDIYSGKVLFSFFATGRFQF